MTYDQAQSPRIGQTQAPENPGVRMVTLSELPEVAYRGQIVFLTDADYLYVYDGVKWNAIGDGLDTGVYVSESDPNDSNDVQPGDQWFQPSTGFITIWDGVNWVDSTLKPNSVKASQLSSDAITAKHVLTGPLIRTRAAPFARIEIKNDGAAGIMQFYTGANGDPDPGRINPDYDGRPIVNINSGSMSGAAGARIRLIGGGAPGDPTRIIELTGDVSCTNGVSATSLQTTAPGTTSNPANARIGSNGVINIVTSSRRYKDNIEDAATDVDQLLQLTPRTFTRKDEAELDDPPVYVGFIAEEAHELGLTQWVDYKDDQPESFEYGSWPVALQMIVRKQQEQIDALTQRVEQLETLLAGGTDD